MNRPAAIFRLLRYEYRLKKNLRYPSFHLRKADEMFFLSLEDAENEMKQQTVNCLDVYAFVISELPLGVSLGADAILRTLSERVYLPDGTLWGERGELCRFNGRDKEEIRFKPGDIVEIFGFTGNWFWSDEEVTLGIVVKCPPISKDVSALSSPLHGEMQDVYEVLYDTPNRIDRSPVIATFRPTLPLSTQREKKLRSIYEQYINMNIKTIH